MNIYIVKEFFMDFYKFIKIPNLSSKINQKRKLSNFIKINKSTLYAKKKDINSKISFSFVFSHALQFPFKIFPFLCV